MFVIPIALFSAHTKQDWWPRRDWDRTDTMTLDKYEIGGFIEDKSDEDIHWILQQKMIKGIWIMYAKKTKNYNHELVICTVVENSWNKDNCVFVCYQKHFQKNGDNKKVWNVEVHISWFSAPVFTQIKYLIYIPIFYHTTYYHSLPVELRNCIFRWRTSSNLTGFNW